MYNHRFFYSLDILSIALKMTVEVFDTRWLTFSIRKQFH